MSQPSTGRSPSTLRSIGAVVAGFLIVAVLSTAGDLASKAAGLIPADGSSPAQGAFAIFTAYRLVFTVLGGYVTARLAPQHPLKHAVILGCIGMAVAIAGSIAMHLKGDYGPAWYNIVLIITAVPLTVAGAKLVKNPA